MNEIKAKKLLKTFFRCALELHELVRLKEIKDREGKTAEYLKARPRAWREAETALHDLEKFNPEWWPYTRKLPEDKT